MPRLKQFIFTIIPILTLSIINGSTGFAQHTQQYHNRNELDAHTIHDVTYHYILSKSDTLFTDEYQSLLFSYHPDSVSNVRKLRLNYENGLLNGEFYLEKAAFRSNNSFPSYRSFRVQQPIRGNSLFASGMYSNGLRTGTWTQYDVTIDGREMDTLNTITTSFSKNGNWHGPFSIHDTLITLQGSFEANFPSGTWSGNIGNKPFELSFKNGVLYSLKTDNYLIHLSDETKQEFKTYNLHEIFSDYIHVTVIGENAPSDVIYLLADEIAQSIRGFVPNKNLTESTNKQYVFDAVQLKLPVNRLSDIDAATLEHLKQKHQQLTQDVYTLINDPNLILSCTDDLQLGESMAALHIASDRLKEMDAVFLIAGSYLNHHINWKPIIQTSTNRINQIAEREYDCLNERRKITIAQQPYNENQSPINNLQLQLDVISNLFDQYNSSLSRQLLEVQFDEELKAIRQEFITAREIFDRELALLDVNYYKEEYVEGFTHFYTLLTQRFKAASDRSEKEQMEDVLNQLKKLTTLLSQTGEWNRIHDVITESYKYMYLDPNTFEERKEILYVQLYKTYERKLMPFVISQLRYNFNHVDEFAASFENIGIVQSKMINVLGNNPKKLNRKLKNRDQIDKVIEKMELKLN